MLAEGRTAPDFVAPAAVDGRAERFRLYEAVERHRAVALLLYPADFVPTCTADLCAVRDAGWASTPDMAVVAVGGDSLFAHAAYADEYGLPFPLVSDFHGGVADSYGLLAADWQGHGDVPRRATVVVDGDWTVRFAAAVEDALDEASPAPVERAAAALGELGLDVQRPAVDYDGPW